MISVRCDLTILVDDDQVEVAVRFLRKSSHDAVEAFHKNWRPHELEITTEDVQ